MTTSIWQRYHTYTKMAVGLEPYGRERCGFVILPEGSMVPVFFEVENEYRGDGDRFQIGPETVLEFLEAFDTEIIGVWHTHPDGKPHPSAEDWESHPKWGNVALFIVERGTVRAYKDKKRTFDPPWLFALTPIRL